MRLWRKIRGFVGSKYLVLRRDGTKPEWPSFVLGAKDPCSSAALRAYAREAESHGFDQEYIRDLREMATEWEGYRARLGVGDPDSAPHRTDDPLTIARMACLPFPEHVLSAMDKQPLKCDCDTPGSIEFVGDFVDRYMPDGNQDGTSYAAVRRFRCRCGKSLFKVVQFAFSLESKLVGVMELPPVADVGCGPTGEAIGSIVGSVLGRVDGDAEPHLKALRNPLDVP